MPVWAQNIRTWGKQHPGMVVLGCLLLAGFLYWAMSPPIPSTQPRVVKAQPLPGLGAQRDVMTDTLLTLQKQNETLSARLTEQDRAMRTLQQAQATAEHERKATADKQAQQFDEQLKRAQKTPAPAPKAAVPPAISPLLTQKTPPRDPEPTIDRGAKVRILRSEKPPSFQGQPPSANRADTPYLPAGSIAEGRVVTGIMASSKTGGMGAPMLFKVVQPFRSPHQLHGPGRDSTPTGVPLQGCVIFGKAQADLGSGRVQGQLTLLSCVFPDKSTFEHPIHGYIADADLTLGLVGELQTHTSAVMAKAFLTGLIQEASAAFGLARSSLVVTQGGAVQTGQGAQTALQEISHFYLEQAREYSPTLWVESNRPVRLVLLEGIELQGFPVRTILTQKESLP
jgi:hypothetical protein